MDLNLLIVVGVIVGNELLLYIFDHLHNRKMAHKRFEKAIKIDNQIVEKNRKKV
ncbi:hypothetical protein [Acidianus bottle-shaped virus 3 strain ABV3]|uniref:Uncharacterized protein n=1 Tax=Acidianus bottle-shaped virus 3 strain ABV3 TaxID=1732174 RepID=A0A0N7FYX9_9VIRU|nr:hypothetical protein AVU00_gp66 [Acidianus bottle-shaped virus 3 strain ABV3]ALG96868.1 hypothetical protein [Acidianus bottle-shaped virus 3 strain ABV3]